MSNAWRQRAEGELNRLLSTATAAGLFGLTRDGLTLAAGVGTLHFDETLLIGDEPELLDALRRGQPWICDDAERWQAIVTEDADALPTIWWPLQGRGVSLGFVAVMGSGLDHNAVFLAQLSRVAGHLVHLLVQRLEHRRGHALNTPFTEPLSQNTSGWPSDPKRRLMPQLDDPMPTGGAAVRDADMVLQLALEDPLGAAAQNLAHLDDWLTTPLTKRFLDTGLEALLPLMTHLPKSRSRVLKLMINAADSQLRHDALHCLERWPDSGMAREVLPLAFSAESGVATAAARVLERCRGHQEFAVEVLKELRTLVADKRAVHAHRRALDLLIRFRDPDAVPLLINRLEDERFKELALRGLSEITLVQSRWSRAGWQSWYSKHAHEPRSLWLLEALDHREIEVRSQAIAELYGETGDNYGYDPSAPSRQRRAAITTARQTIIPGQAGATP